MGKLLQFPFVAQPSRPTLVEEAANLIFKEVQEVFATQSVEKLSSAIWFKEIRNYLWREEIKLDTKNQFRAQDIKRWKAHWRNQAFNYINSKTLR